MLTNWKMSKERRLAFRVRVLSELSVLGYSSFWYVGLQNLAIGPAIKALEALLRSLMRAM